MTVAEAADRLRKSEHAIRQRIRRGTIGSEKDSEGRVWVFVQAEAPGVSGEPHGEPSPDATDLLRERAERIESLERALEAERQANQENRRIIAGLTQRIPELQAAPESPDVGPGEAPEGRSPGPAQTAPERATSRPWWRRIFDR